MTTYRLELPKFFVAKTMTEKELSQNVVDAARSFGWMVYRTWRSIHSEAGYPDLTMVKPPRVLFAELKRQGQRATMAQIEWLESLGACPQVETYTWYPMNWLDGTITGILGREA